MGQFLSGIKGKLLAWAVVAAVLIPATMCGISAANKPETYPGDQIDWRTCRDCSAKGCQLCDGKGSLWVITPGPNHPVWVPVHVFRKGTPQTGSEDRLKAIPGAVPGARVSFSKAGKTVEETSGLTGRTRVRLAPGTWSSDVKRDGYREATGSLEVPVLKGEIWKTRSAEDTLEAPLQVPLEGP